MSVDNSLEIGSIVDNGEVIVFEMPSEKTTIKVAEQLEELKRPDEQFFTCKHSIIDEDWVRIYVKRNRDFQNIQAYVHAPADLKYIVIENLMKLNRLVGTQYTTTLHPKNIYVNNKGDVKLVHRGIRHVLPPKEFNEKQLLEEMKQIVVYLFTGNYVASTENLVTDSEMPSFEKQINQAPTLFDILHIVQNRDKKLIANWNEEESSKLKKVDKVGSKKVSMLSGILIGFLCGLLFLYVLQVMPIKVASSNMESTFSDRENELQHEKDVLEQEISQLHKIKKAYQLLHEGEIEQAISLFESVDSLPAEEEKVLTNLYLESANPNYVVKAVDSDQENLGLVIEKLAAMNSSEANNLILSLQTEDPLVMIEQAWLKKEYDLVFDMFDKMKDNNRAKLLAARTYLEVDKPEEALILGRELGELSIQISSLEKLIELTEKDTSLNRREKEEKLADLKNQLDELTK